VFTGAVLEVSGAILGTSHSCVLLDLIILFNFLCGSFGAIHMPSSCLPDCLHVAVGVGLSSILVVVCSIAAINFLLQVG